MMSIKNRKSKRVKFGMFLNEKLAWEHIEHMKKYHMKQGLDETYYVVKKNRHKDDRYGRDGFRLGCHVLRLTRRRSGRSRLLPAR